MEPLVAEGEFSLAGLPLPRYAPLYEERVKFDVNDGVLDFKTKYRYSAGAAGNTTLTGLSAELKSPRLTKRGDKQPFFQAPYLLGIGHPLDQCLHLAEPLLQLGLARGPRCLACVREREEPGPGGAVAEPPAGAAAPAGHKDRAGGWRSTDTVKITDLRRAARAVRVNDSTFLWKFSTAHGSGGTLATRFSVDGKGAASAKGPLVSPRCSPT
jgi:hypothetical protein